MPGSGSRCSRITASGNRFEANDFVQRFWLTEPVASRSNSTGLLEQAQRKNNAAVRAIKRGLKFASSADRLDAARSSIYEQSSHSDTRTPHEGGPR